MLEKFASFEEKIGTNFENKDLLVQAFTHRSFLNENQDFGLGHNERLEFLGDAVLELVTTEYLFSKFPERPEGELTAIRAALVNTTSLSETARDLGVNEFLLLSKGESKDLGRARSYILANTFEALVGAIYLDRGYDPAKDFILRFLMTKTEEVISKNLWQDAKSLFQEKAQDETGITPVYKTTKEIGPDHAKKFTVGVYLKDNLVAEGEGYSKQEAETEAARTALSKGEWV